MCGNELHRMTPENTYVYTSPDGYTSRRCRACKNYTSRELHYAIKDAARIRGAW